MTWAFQVESSQLHYTYLPAGKSCWFESMIPNVLIHNKSCSSYSYQYHVKLQSWHVSQSISDHAGTPRNTQHVNFTGFRELSVFQNDNKGQQPITTSRIYVNLNSVSCHANIIVHGNIHQICHQYRNQLKRIRWINNTKRSLSLCMVG